jgi:hypothetical protein
MYVDGICNLSDFIKAHILTCKIKYELLYIMHMQI